MENNELQTLRHSASHILAQAVKRQFPGTKLAIGPAIENGFYYDFDSEVSFTPETLEKLEEEMKKIVKENLRIERFVLPRDKALRYAAQTLIGTGELALASGEHPGLLKDRVCSPAGTTIQGVRSLEHHAVRGAFCEAVIAAYEKTLAMQGPKDQ